MSDIEKVLDTIYLMTEYRFTTLNICSHIKCRDVDKRNVQTALAKLVKEKIIKVVARRKIKPFPNSQHKNKVNVYERC